MAGRDDEIVGAVDHARGTLSIDCFPI